jgi:hypothetical protein
MAKTVEQIIKEADVLIKQEKYSEAWKLLLPHKEDENARKRLKWLKSKQEQLKLEKEIAAAPVKEVKPNWFMGLGWRAKVFVGSVFLCSGCILFSMLGQTLGFIPDATERAATEIVRANETSAILTQNAPTATETITASATFTESPSATNSPAPSTTFTATASETIPPTLTDSSIGVRSGASNATSAPSATFMASPSATITNTPLPRATNTPAPPTATYAIIDSRNREQLDSVETMLLGILEQTEGVDFVQTLSIQGSGDYRILYGDIVVYPNYNILAIPRSLDEAANEAMGGSLSETFINMSDGVHGIAYTRNARFPNWDILVYGDSVIPPTPRPR